MVETDPHAARKRWMAVLARAPAGAMDACLAAVRPLPAHVLLRGPETGLVMVRGRAGGGGPAFNLGEVTVTRCTVRDAGGRLGHAYLTGRDARRAELAAALDAALQDPERHAELERGVIAPLAAAQAAARAAEEAKAAATRVEFFTMANMRT